MYLGSISYPLFLLPHSLPPSPHKVSSCVLLHGPYCDVVSHSLKTMKPRDCELKPLTLSQHKPFLFYSLLLGHFVTVTESFEMIILALIPTADTRVSIIFHHLIGRYKGSIDNKLQWYPSEVRSRAFSASMGRIEISSLHVTGERHGCYHFILPTSLGYGKHTSAPCLNPLKLLVGGLGRGLGSPFLVPN